MVQGAADSEATCNLLSSQLIPDTSFNIIITFYVNTDLTNSRKGFAERSFR